MMDHPSRRRVLTSAVGGALVASTPLMAQSSPGAYPGATVVHMVVPFTPAGATDIVGRTMADGLAAVWGTQTLVDNVPGVGGNLGMDRVANGPTDGSLLLTVPVGLTTNQFLYKSLSFNPETDIRPLSQAASMPNLLAVRNGLPVHSVAELIAYAKANPGKLNFASSGVGTTLHLSGELFKKEAGIDMVHVVYKGSAPAISDLIAGNVDLMFDNLPSIGPQAKAGNVRGLAVTTKVRSQFAPDYPTIADTLPGFDVQAWFGVGLRAGTPPAIVDAVEAAAIAACKRDDVKKRMAAAWISVVGSDRKQFGAFVDSERKRWGDLIHALQIKPQ